MDHITENSDHDVSIELPSLPFPWENLTMLVGVIAGGLVLITMLWR